MYHNQIIVFSWTFLEPLSCLDEELTKLCQANLKVKPVKWNIFACRATSSGALCRSWKSRSMASATRAKEVDWSKQFYWVFSITGSVWKTLNRLLFLCMNSLNKGDVLNALSSSLVWFQTQFLHIQIIWCEIQKLVMDELGWSHHRHTS